MSREPHSLPKVGDISQLFILGDSYSDVGWVLPGCPLPTRDKPLGIDDPCGWVRWMSVHDWQENWHLSLECQALNQDLRVYDFAVGGSFVSDVVTQGGQLADLLSEPSFELQPDTALLVVWVGINDVSGVTKNLVEDAMDTYDDILTQCHKLGFRNLLLIDVPPRRRLGPTENAHAIYDVIKDNIEDWNTALTKQLSSWNRRRGTAGKIFSSYQLFRDILDNPTQYGFDPSDPHATRGGIWIDHIHPTTKVHRILFERIKECLS